MTRIREMIDVNIIVGEAIEANGATIIPISKVRCGFVSGGVDQKKSNLSQDHPFGGGAGGTMTITPVAFLVCTSDDVKILHLNEGSHLFDRIIDSISRIIDHFFKKEKKGEKPLNEPTVYSVEKE